MMNEEKMTSAVVVSDWRQEVVYNDEGPEPNVLFENERVKVIAAGLEPGQQIPNHPEALAVYHILEGKGWMTVDGRRLAIGAGSTIVTPEGSVRGMAADSRLSFLAARIA